MMREERRQKVRLSERGTVENKFSESLRGVGGERQETGGAWRGEAGRED